MRLGVRACALRLPSLAVAGLPAAKMNARLHAAVVNPCLSIVSSSLLHRDAPRLFGILVEASCAPRKQGVSTIAGSSVLVTRWNFLSFAERISWASLQRQCWRLPGSAGHGHESSQPSGTNQTDGSQLLFFRHPRGSGGPGPQTEYRPPWVPAFAGMTVIACRYHPLESDH